MNQSEPYPAPVHPPWRRWARRGAAWWTAFPAKVMLLITVLCLVIGDFYPFSDFPMFQRFADNTYYVFLADQDGQPLPCRSFSLQANGLKKAYQSQLDGIRKTLPKKSKLTTTHRAQAAEATLQFVARRASRRRLSGTTTAIKLIRVDITLEKGHLKKEHHRLAELALE